MTDMQLRFNKRDVEQSLSASAERKRKRRAREKRFELAFLLILLAFIGGAAAGVNRRAPWYVDHVAPWMERGMAWAMDVFAAWGNSSAASSRAAIVLPTYPEPEWPAWLDEGPADSTDRADPPDPPARPDPPDPPDVTLAAGHHPPPPSLDISSRPKPADLDFGKHIQAVREHVLRQPPSVRRLEADRAIHVAGARGHLIKLMKYIPYQTGPQGLHLRGGGNTPPGTVITANPNGVLFSPQRGTGGRTLSWEELALEQYVAFFQYYIARRIELDGTPSWNMTMEAAQLTPVQAKRDAAGECLLVGLLCDWYGNPQLGRKFLQLALDYDPDSPAGTFLQ